MSVLGKLLALSLFVSLIVIALPAQQLTISNRITVPRFATVEIPFTVHHTAGTGQRLTARLVLSNPTVFFPQQFSVNGIKQASAIQRESEQIFRISIDLDSTDSSRCMLGGITLAGNDSLCRLNFDSLRIATTSLDSVSTLLVVQDTSGIWHSYLRFASVSESMPCPAYDGTALRWTIRLDEASDVDCMVYDSKGRMIRAYTTYAPIGTSEFVFQPDALVYPGSYELYLRCSTGEARRRFVIVR